MKTNKPMRKPLRIVKAFDEYIIKTGNAGFVKVFKNGKRVQSKNNVIVFRKRKK